MHTTHKFKRQQLLILMDNAVLHSALLTRTIVLNTLMGPQQKKGERLFHGSIWMYCMLAIR